MSTGPAGTQRLRTDSNRDRYPRHHHSEVEVDTDAPTLFAHLDDHRRLASHMDKPSSMMADGSVEAPVRSQYDVKAGKGS